jgi:hypothetical protein
VLQRGAFSSTSHTGTDTDTGSGGGSGKRGTEASQLITAMVTVGTATAVAVHLLDRSEMARIQDRAASEVAQAKAEVACIEGDRK